eukprot:GGOE01053791.1.p1 GENE.GGOE01053791.1~~GGOE01053791.1.p1  ORF type:complete len:332 (+),score=44.45 GGOE01053791.1:48-1043(+)
MQALRGCAPHVLPSWLAARAASSTFRHQGTYTYFRDIPFHVPVWRLKPGGVAGVQALDPYAFNCSPRADILHRVVVWQLACRRVGLAKSKSRGEVSYSGRKIRPQKGTGKSRQGDKGSPILRGGGRAFPKRQRDWSYPLPEDVQILGLRMALTAKLVTGRLIVVDDLPLLSSQLHELTSLVKPWLPSWEEINNPFAPLRGVLVLEGGTYEEPQEKASRDAVSASRGEQWLSVMAPAEANVYDILRRKFLVVTTGALRQLHARLYPHKMAQAPLWYQTANPPPLPEPDTKWIMPGPRHLTGLRRFTPTEENEALSVVSRIGPGSAGRLETLP